MRAAGTSGDLQNRKGKPSLTDSVGLLGIAAVQSSLAGTLNAVTHIKSGDAASDKSCGFATILAHAIRWRRDSTRPSSSIQGFKDLEPNPGVPRDGETRGISGEGVTLARFPLWQGVTLARFPLWQVVATPDALAALSEAGDSPASFLRRHRRHGDRPPTAPSLTTR